MYVNTPSHQNADSLSLRAPHDFMERNTKEYMQRNGNKRISKEAPSKNDLSQWKMMTSGKSQGTIRKRQVNTPALPERPISPEGTNSREDISSNTEQGILKSEQENEMKFREWENGENGGIQAALEMEDFLSVQKANREMWKTLSNDKEKGKFPAERENLGNHGEMENFPAECRVRRELKFDDDAMRELPGKRYINTPLPPQTPATSSDNESSSSDQESPSQNAESYESNRTYTMSCENGKELNQNNYDNAELSETRAEREDFYKVRAVDAESFGRKENDRGFQMTNYPDNEDVTFDITKQPSDDYILPKTPGLDDTVVVGVGCAKASVSPKEMLGPTDRAHQVTTHHRAPHEKDNSRYPKNYPEQTGQNDEILHVKHKSNPSLTRIEREHLHNYRTPQGLGYDNRNQGRILENGHSQTIPVKQKSPSLAQIEQGHSFNYAYSSEKPYPSMTSLQQFPNHDRPEFPRSILKAPHSMSDQNLMPYNFVKRYTGKTFGKGSLPEESHQIQSSFPPRNEISTGTQDLQPDNASRQKIEPVEVLPHWSEKRAEPIGASCNERSPTQIKPSFTKAKPGSMVAPKANKAKKKINSSYLSKLAKAKIIKDDIKHEREKTAEIVKKNKKKKRKPVKKEPELEPAPIEKPMPQGILKHSKPSRLSQGQVKQKNIRPALSPRSGGNIRSGHNITSKQLTHQKGPRHPAHQNIPPRHLAQVHNPVQPVYPMEPIPLFVQNPSRQPPNQNVLRCVGVNSPPNHAVPFRLPNGQNFIRPPSYQRLAEMHAGNPYHNGGPINMMQRVPLAQNGNIYPQTMTPYMPNTAQVKKMNSFCSLSIGFPFTLTFSLNDFVLGI